MPLGLPTGSACFIDANIFVYHFTNTDALGLACTDLLRRGTIGEIQAATSIPVLADTLHKIMLAEVRAREGLNMTGLVAWIQKHRNRLAGLKETLAACSQIERLPLAILPLDIALLRQAMQISASHHLLTGDAIAIALMQRHGLTHLVTNDDDFDAIPGLTVWKPR